MSKTAVVLGAGVTGLSVAWKLSENGWDVHVVESSGKIGGMSSCFEWKGMRLDYGPHKMYSQLPVFNDVVGLFSNEELLNIPKKSRIRLLGKFFEYPLKTQQLIKNVSPFKSADFVFSYGFAAVRNIVARKEDTNYETYMANRFGSSIYSTVFGPYALKAWGDPKHLDKSLAASRIAVPSLLEMLKRMVMGDKGKPELSAAEFRYPKKGVDEISKKMLHKSNAKLYLKSKLKMMDSSDGKISSVEFESNGKAHEIKADFVVSTIPLRSLAQLLPSAPESLMRSVSNLKSRSILLLYVEIDRPRLFDDNWIFFPESKYIFNRLSEQKGFSASMIGDNRTVLCIEVTTSEDSDVFKMKDGELLKECMKGLEDCGLLKEEEVKDYFVVRMGNAYPVYSVGYKDELDNVLKHVERYSNLLTIGRQGLFSYTGMIDCIDMGTKTADFIISGNGNWKEVRKGFEDYVTID